MIEPNKITPASDNLNILFDKSPQPMMIFETSSLRLLDVNDAAVKIYGYSRSEFLQMSIKDFRPVENMADVASVNLMENEIFTMESRHIYANKTLVDVQVTSFPFRFKGKNSRLAYVRDITSKKKRQSLLEFLNLVGVELGLSLNTSSALEKISELIVPKFANWFTINVIKGNDVEMILVKNTDPDYVQWALNHRKLNPVYMDGDTYQSHLLRTGESSLIPLITKDMLKELVKDQDLINKMIGLNLRSSITVPMIVRNQVTGNISFISSVEGKQYDKIDLDFAKDLAIRIGLSLENARLHEEAQHEIYQRKQAEKVKDDFIGIASHELKTPLTSLTATLQMADRFFRIDSSSTNGSKMLEQSTKSLKKLSLLINQLLDSSKIEGGQLKLEKKLCDLNALAFECAETINSLGSHRVLVEGSNIEMIFADPARLEQVITNFMNNAVKYSPTSALIKCLIEKAGDKVKLSVIDNGIGVPPEKLPFIFDRYYRVDNSGVQFSGLGLGLYISSEIIKLHEGEIGAFSEFGKGSNFWFTLPGL